MRSELVWAIIQRVVIIPYQCSGTDYLQGTVCPETSVRKYHYSPEESSTHLPGGGILTSHTWRLIILYWKYFQPQNGKKSYNKSLFSSDVSFLSKGQAARELETTVKRNVRPLWNIFAVIKFGKNKNNEPKYPPLDAQQSYGHLTYKAYDRVAQNFDEDTSKFWTPRGGHEKGPIFRAKKYYSPL